MSQTTYNLNMDVAVEGLEGDAAGAAKRRVTYLGDVEIPFGRAVALEVSGADLCKLPDDAGDQIVGIANRDLTEPNGTAATDNTYPVGASVCVIKQGTVWVRAEVAVTPTDDVFVRHTAGAGGSDLGSFRNDADTATALQITQARYLGSADAGDLVLVEINIP